MSTAGVVSVDAFGIQTGSGIGVLDALGDAADRPPSRLDLIAPRGEVNAGDAGIRVVGNLNIAAQVVVGVENIQTTGAASGVPKVEVPSVGAVTTASQVAQAATKEGIGPAATAATKNPVADLPSIITVEVVGYETTGDGEAPSDQPSEKREKKR
jgi:Filamentous haemagglutinin family outer membrane protein